MDTQLLSRLQGSKRAAWQALLRQSGLEPDDDFDVTALIWENDTLLAAGSRKGDLLKCIAVESSRQGEGLTATLLTQLRQDAFRAGHRHLFLYTKPKNRQLFSSLFFYPVAQTADVLLMEDKKDGLKDFLNSLPAETASGTVGAAVMNCNPFTLGHRYLIETAARECDRVYVFVLSEDRSRFSAADRLEMVRLGTADLPNVTVLPTGPYLISGATFPTYFLPDRDAAPQVQCLLDIEIFARNFAKKYGISRRYAGTEPLSDLTHRYNLALQAHLPARGVQLRLLPRLELEGHPVSATAVRGALDAGDWDTVKRLVPESTFSYLYQRRNPHA